MSKIKKGIKKVGKFIKKNWKPIVAVAAGLFTAGIATVGTAGFSGAMSAAGGGLTGALSAAGSTMWAGATGLAGTIGLGSGASGAAATASGMTGSTLLNGAAAQAMGFGSKAVSGLQDSLKVGSGWKSPARSASEAMSNVQRSGFFNGSQVSGLFGQQSIGQTIAQAAIPAAFQMGGAYLQAQGTEEMNEPKGLFGVNLQSGESFQPSFNQGLLADGAMMNPYPGNQYMGGPMQGAPRQPRQPGDQYQPDWTGRPPSVNYPIWQGG